MADPRARTVNLVSSAVIDLTVLRCVAAVGLLAGWAGFLLVHAPGSTLLSPTPGALLVAPVSGLVVLFAAGLVSGSFAAWWAAAGVLSVAPLVALHPGHSWVQPAVAMLALAVLVAAGHSSRPGPPASSLPGWLIAAGAAELAAAVLGVAAQLSVLPVPVLVSALLAVGLTLYRQHGRPPLVLGGGTLAERGRLRHGRSHISCFAGADDKRAVELPGGAVVAFRVAAGVAVVAGDPLGRHDQVPRAIADFIALCDRQGWTPCFFQTIPSTRAAYQRAGLRTLTFGEEAVVDLAGFSLAGSARANLRHEVARARRAGLTEQLLTWSGADASLRAELDSISTAWLRRHSGRELGFSLGRHGETIDSQALLTVVRGPSGRVEAFTTWLRLGDDGIGLDVVRRRHDAGPGAVDLAIAATLEDARQRGLRIASLGLVPFRDSGDDVACGGPVLRRARAALYARSIGGYRYRTLARFKDKFGPHWEPRDIAFPHEFAAAAVLTALVAVHITRP